jgi:hypothetical protein
MRYFVATLIIRTAVVRIGYKCGFITSLWWTYWFSGWNVFFCSRDRIGFRVDTVIGATWIGLIRAGFLFCTVVKIVRALVVYGNPTNT